ncbi:MAG: 4-hydroxy-3-methylbut-2-enyl diphosphate reductase, partial [Actinomadura rubrobrunea]|nr:4-hydroxy-3-methylbut-2-enyl diphosphate reductase [Actinomadura rubrobrunea]
MTSDRRPARLVVCAALGIEARAAARPGLRVVTVGVGPRRAEKAAARLPPFDALAVTGFAGSLDARVRPGSLVVATEIRGPDGAVACPSAELIAGLLERDGAPVHRGPLLTCDRVVTGRRERAALAATGALAVDMESAPLAAAAAGRPFAVVRAVVDTPEHPLFSPATLAGG